MYVPVTWRSAIAVESRVLVTMWATALHNMNNQLTFDELRAYQAGQLTGPARNRVERLLLQDPFYADALAGLEAMQKTAMGVSGEVMTTQMADLHRALNQRIHESATKKRLWPLWIATATAAILFMLVMAIYFIYFVPKQNTKPRPTQPVRTTINREKPSNWRSTAWTNAPDYNI